MNYVQDVMKAIVSARVASGRKPYHPDLVKLYTLLVLTKGVDMELADIHDAWAVMNALEIPDDADMVPFASLSHENHMKDKRHLDLLLQVADAMEP